MDTKFVWHACAGALELGDSHHGLAGCRARAVKPKCMRKDLGVCISVKLWPLYANRLVLRGAGILWY